MLSDNRSRRLQSLFMRGAAALLLSLTTAAPMMLAASYAIAQTEKPVSGGTMTIINGSDIKSWDPAITAKHLSRRSDGCARRRLRLYRLRQR